MVKHPREEASISAVFPRVLQAWRKCSLSETSIKQRPLVITPDSQSHTSSPSSSTTGFLTLIFFPSSAIVRVCVRCKEVTPDQREEAETRDLATFWGNREVEDEIEREAEGREKEEEKGGAEVRVRGGAEAKVRRANAEESRSEFIVAVLQRLPLPTGHPGF